MTPTREAVVEAVVRVFGEANAQSILAMLDEYGAAPHEPERERVQLALISLAAGDREALRRLLRVARQDYRDILCWAQIGPATASEGERLQAAARQLIERWGDK